MSRSIFLAAFVLLIGCASKPDLANKKTHKDSALEVSYPGNWALEVKDEDTDGIKIRTVSVEPPDGVAQILVFTPAVPLDVEDFAMRLLKGMDAELSDYAVGGVELLGKVDGKKKPLKRTISGTERDGLEMAFSMSALNQKIPMTLQLYTLEGEKASAVIFAQSADEDLARDRPGFSLIFDSLALK